MKITNNINYWSLLGVVILAIGFFKSDSVIIATAVIIFALLSCTIDILRAIEAKVIKPTNQDSN
jgi:uncharacterized membrane protein